MAAVTLDRARFAGRGVRGTDVAVGARDGIALCDVSVERSGETRPPAAFGRLVLDVRDGDGGPAVPARVGLYDATGRAPLPSERALTIHRFTDEVRLLRVNARTAWPSDNRLAFYVDGRYESRLPAGEYELVVTRGPEYRSHRAMVDVRAGETSSVTVSLRPRCPYGRGCCPTSSVNRTEARVRSQRRARVTPSAVTSRNCHES